MPGWNNPECKRRRNFHLPAGWKTQGESKWLVFRCCLVCLVAE